MLLLVVVVVLVVALVGVLGVAGAALVLVGGTGVFLLLVRRSNSAAASDRITALSVGVKQWCWLTG